MWEKETGNNEKSIYKEDRKIIRENNEQTKLVSTSKNKQWRASERLDLISVGLREATKQSELQGFKPIRGKGPVKANLATLRMLARAYNTPCPVDVVEKVLEGAVERAGSVPIQAMGNWQKQWVSRLR